MKLLEKARKLNRLMQNGESVKYKEVALLLRNLISSNVYVIDVKGTILGYGLLDEFECDVMRDMVLANQCFPDKYMEEKLSPISVIKTKCVPLLIPKSVCTGKNVLPSCRSTAMANALRP